MDIQERIKGEMVTGHAIIEVLGYSGMKSGNLERQKTLETLAGKTGQVLANGSKELISRKEELKNKLGFGNQQNAGTIEVRYNPSTLKIHASTSEYTDHGSENEDKMKITTVTEACNMTLSMDLIFTADGPLDTSVKDQINIFLQTILTGTNKRVRFSWGKMSMTGTITSFSSEYDMFTAGGVPVSGKVSLSILRKMTPQEIAKTFEKIDTDRKDKLAENEGE